MELKKPPPVRRLTGSKAAARRRARDADKAMENDERQRPPSVRGSSRRRDAPRASAVAIDRMQIEEVSISLRGQARGEEGLAADPSGRGTRADRSVGLRQDDAAALAQPPHRADQDGVDERPHHARRRRHRDHGADRAAPPGDDGLPAAEPVPDERVRQRGLRAARAGGTAPPARDAARRGARRAGSSGAATTRSPTTSTIRRCGSRAANSSVCASPSARRGPEVLLLDEPCSALDPQSTKIIEDLIVKLREELAVVIVTHNLQQAHRDRRYVAFMYLGELVEYGMRQQLFAAPRRGPDEGVRQWCVRLACRAR